MGEHLWVAWTFFMFFLFFSILTLVYFMIWARSQSSDFNHFRQWDNAIPLGKCLDHL